MSNNNSPKSDKKMMIGETRNTVDKLRKKFELLLLETNRLMVDRMAKVSTVFSGFESIEKMKELVHEELKAKPSETGYKMQFFSELVRLITNGLMGNKTRKV